MSASRWRRESCIQVRTSAERLVAAREQPPVLFCDRKPGCPAAQCFKARVTAIGERYLSASVLVIAIQATRPRKVG